MRPPGAGAAASVMRKAPATGLFVFPAHHAGARVPRKAPALPRKVPAMAEKAPSMRLAGRTTRSADGIAGAFRAIDGAVFATHATSRTARAPARCIAAAFIGIARCGGAGTCRSNQLVVATCAARR